MKYLFVYCLMMVFKINAQNNNNYYNTIPNNSQYRNVNPFTNILENTALSFTGKNSFFHLAGLASTYVIINSGIDYKIHNYFFEHNFEYNSFATPAVYIGYLAPVIIGGGLFGYGKIKNDSKIVAAGSAALQAALISTVYISLLKAITGRPNPDSILYSAINQGSSTFRFGFLNGGIHYGWPSGHLGVNTAVVASLLYFYKDNTWLKLLGGAYIAYLTFGVIAHDGNTMHWASDILTGLLIGYAIGSRVGIWFRDNHNKTGAYNIQPALNGNGAAINFKIKL
jgi:membrane-associated phospholipid phosphatase